MKAIVNTTLILEDSLIWNGAITWENGRITALGRREEVDIPADAEVIDAKGLYTAPGLIDIHNHGGPDFLFHEDPRHCAEFFLQHGETTVLPTFYCNLTLEQMLDGAEKVKTAAQSGAGKILNGLYLFKCQDRTETNG